ncbi:MAG: hypothetical protein FWD73_09450 [Polyangiaceae bacterium]|nr:hypothetical protein [Polyangiaceae bacterium]
MSFQANEVTHRFLRFVLSMTPIALAGLGVIASACNACGRNPSSSSNAPSAEAAAANAARTSAPADAGPVAVRDVALWTHAKDGNIEDLAALATHEGAAGLVEAAADPELRATALRAMGAAPGYAQTPFLAQVAAGKSTDDARLALDALIEIAERVRRQDDAEDAGELREACEQILALAKDTKQPNDRRVPAIRALRMLPCPKTGIPTELDAR